MGIEGGIIGPIVAVAAVMAAYDIGYFPFCHHVDNNFSHANSVSDCGTGHA